MRNHRLIAGIAGMALRVGVGCDSETAAEGNLATPRAPTGVFVSGGWLDHDPGAVIRSAESNRIIVRARIVSVGATRVHAPPGVHEMPFTPVEVVVTDSLRGGHELDDRLTLRIFGGSIGATTYFIEDAPSLDGFVPGAEFILFTQEIVTFDGLAAATPNHVYRIEDGRAVDVIEGVHSTDAAQFLADLRARLGLSPTRRRPADAGLLVVCMQC